jgi:hypothetical protein
LWARALRRQCRRAAHPCVAIVMWAGLVLRDPALFAALGGTSRRGGPAG